MENGIDAEKETLQSLVRSCLLELNKLKFELTELEVEKANDNSASRIRELEQDIVDKEKEVSVIKFKAEEEINQLQGQIDERDLLIKNQEDRIYELDYVNNSLDEIKTYFAEQLREYKRNELSEVNERLNESYRSIAEKDAQINNLSRTIDEYKIQVIKLENDAGAKQEIMELEKQIEFKNSELQQKDNEISAIDNQLVLLRQQSIPKQDYDNLQAQFENEIAAMDNEINFLKEQTIPKSEYVDLQNQLQNEIIARDNELKYLREQTVSREEYINLQNELIRKNDKIKRLEEINAFFNELQEEQDSYETIESTPPFRLEKRERR
ncbi:MAG: glycosyl transferase [Methanobrevibacter sp.]|nr:glycosyl transferase [Methanobrevibacter sp.]